MDGWMYKWMDRQMNVYIDTSMHYRQIGRDR